MFLTRTATARLAIGLTIAISTATSATAESLRCAEYTAGQKNIYWGDLHVHTRFSLDAYAFGNRNDPGDAYAFAKGQSLTLADNKTIVALDQPLDFMAVTDHAETFDVLYICDDPQYSDLPYCREFRHGSSDPETSIQVFREFLLPLLIGDAPLRSPVCDTPGVDCDLAAAAQWRRTQEYANRANAPCEFTAFIGNEWSATPNDRHWHRNLIFKGEQVTREAIDYIRYPTVEALWQALDAQCKAEHGCEVLAIPHNTNMGEGGAFDVENSDQAQLLRRAKYERLIEIHQIKGNSECLPEHWDDTGADCGFERLLLPTMQQAIDANSEGAEAMWRKTRAGYVRALLLTGLRAYSRSGEDNLNPLQLGVIGSTDNHVGTPGASSETNWKGDANGWGDNPARRMQRLTSNPGGLVAVWAEQNTRDDIFAALQRRETYATSGTRIAVNFSADPGAEDDPCAGDTPTPGGVPMGGVLNTPKASQPRFTVRAAMDPLNETPLQKIEIVKGMLRNGELRQQVLDITPGDEPQSQYCVTWQDPDFAIGEPAFWYVRVLEQATPRWSKLDCEALGECDDYPGADRMTQERAWSSPIWYLP